MKIIGITGPTGAGKTTALNALRRLGAVVVDADAVYHRLLSDSVPLKKSLVEAFGERILDDGGRIDRKRLSQAVYPDGLGKLNELTHPFILERIGQEAERARQEGRAALAVDAIALVECGLGAKCDAVVAILAPVELRIQRIMARDGIDEAYARRRVAAQQSDDFFRANSSYVLENREGDTPKAFEARALALFEKILAQG